MLASPLVPWPVEVSATVSVEPVKLPAVPVARVTVGATLPPATIVPPLGAIAKGATVEAPQIRLSW